MGKFLIPENMKRRRNTGNKVENNSAYFSYSVRGMLLHGGSLLLPIDSQTVVFIVLVAALSLRQNGSMLSWANG